MRKGAQTYREDVIAQQIDTHLNFRRKKLIPLKLLNGDCRIFLDHRRQNAPLKPQKLPLKSQYIKRRTAFG